MPRRWAWAAGATTPTYTSWARRTGPRSPTVHSRGRLVSVSPLAIPLHTTSPLIDDRIDTTDPLEIHWLTMAMMTRLVRGRFPPAAAAEFDMFYFTAGEGSPDLITVLDQTGSPLWMKPWLDDDDIAWTTTEGYTWDDVCGEIGGEVGGGVDGLG